MSTIDIENSLGITFCERLPLAFTHGSGTRVWDEAGKQYLDFTSGWGVTCLGHAHPVVVSTLAAQAARLMQSPNAGFVYSPERAALLQTLQAVLPANLTNTFFCNSGAEANDAALKLARKLTGKRKVVTTLGAFHGRSFNTLSVSRGTDNTGRYLPQMPEVVFVPHGDVEAMARTIDGDTAAVIVEPVQGEGGVRIPADFWLGEVQDLCRAHRTLLIIDEIQTGFCRTGKFFALEHSPVTIKPDIMTMAKGIACGFPFAAFAVSADVNALIQKDDHGGTYCGNPLGCSLATAVIGYLERHNVASRVQLSGSFLMQALHGLWQQFPDLIKQVRGLGLLCALELHDHALARPLTLRCAEQGLLVVPTRNGVIRLLPDLLVSRADLETAVAIFREVLQAAA
ncbi:MAG TPA: aspartate aminotransferase family protein [Candidatus Acidoferrum sp.]|nr:aspartate aminotransferase family protein [Candidatus Acidoferrum sp.]